VAVFDPARIPIAPRTYDESAPNIAYAAGRLPVVATASRSVDGRPPITRRPCLGALFARLALPGSSPQRFFSAGPSSSGADHGYGSNEHSAGSSTRVRCPRARCYWEDRRDPTRS